jgi:hypothetical protein
MENQKILARTIGLQKTTFTNTMAIISTMQQYGEDLLKTTLKQSSWLPGSSKDACLYWADCSSKYLENIKAVVDQGFTAIESLASPDTKPGKDESQQTVTPKRTPVPRQAKKSPSVKKKSVSTKKTEIAKTVPSKEAVAQKVSVEKSVPQSVPDKKPVALEKLEEKKSDEAKATTSIPQPLVTGQPTAPPALEDKESAKKPL